MGRLLLVGIVFIACSFLIEAKKNNVGYSISRVYSTAESEYSNNDVDTVRGSGCGCANYSCGCCAHLEIDEINLNDTLCTNMTYLPDDYGISVTVTINGVVYYNNTVSLKNPPPICLGIPHLKHLASVCIQFWNMSTRNHSLSGCIRVEAELKGLVIKTYELGCFKIPPGSQTKVQSLSSSYKRPKLVKLHPYLITASTKTIHIKSAGATRSLGCECLYYDCGCCAHLELDLLKINHTACVNLTMQMETSLVNMTISVDKIVYFNETISLKELSPVCVPLIPMKDVDVCVQLYNITLKDAKIRGCARMIIELEGHPLNISDLGCYKLPLPLKESPLLFKPMKKNNFKTEFQYLLKAVYANIKNKKRYPNL